MKKALLLFAFVVAASGSATAQSAAPGGDGTILTAYRYLSQQYPRTEGSAGERRTVGYIEQTLKSIGVSYNRQDFRQLSGTHSFSSSLEVDLPGARAASLVVAVPLDHPQHTAQRDDGAINIALALGLIESLHSAHLPISVKFLFLGGEFGSGPGYPIGTREFLANFYPDYPVAVLYLDFRYLPQRTNITAGGRGIVTPYWLINRCSSAMDRSGLFYLLRGNENQIFRLGLIETPPAIDPYLKAGYPALELSSLPGRLPQDEYGKWINSFVGFVKDFIAASDHGFPTNWDRHYLFFQARFFSFIITEQGYVITVVVILGLLLLYPLVFRDRFMRYLGTVRRNLLSIPLLLGLVYLFLLLGTLLIEGISLIRNSPDIWMKAPLLFFACKGAGALFLFTLLYRFLKNLPFSRNGRFYSAAAILLLLVDTIVLGTLNFSLAYYFVWALVWAVVFSLVPSRWLKIIIIAIAAGWLVKATVDIFTLPATDVVRVILLSRIKGNIVIALIILPFLFMIIRVDLLFRHPHRARGMMVVRVIDTLLGAATVGLGVYLSLVTVYGPRNPQPITVEELMNLNTNRQTIQVSSPAPIGTIEIKTPGLSQSFSTRARSYSTSIRGDRAIVQLTATSTAFLDRKRVDLEIKPVGRPYRISLGLSSPEQIVIFDANFPFSYSTTGRQATIHIGVNPPTPLHVQFTVPQKASVTLTLQMSYTTLPFPLEVTGKNIAVERRLVVTRELPLSALQQAKQE